MPSPEGVRRKVISREPYDPERLPVDTLECGHRYQAAYRGNRLKKPAFRYCRECAVNVEGAVETPPPVLSEVNRED